MEVFFGCLFLLMGLTAVGVFIWIVRFWGIENYFRSIQNHYQRYAPHYAHQERSLRALTYTKLVCGLLLGVSLIVAGCVLLAIG
jgi:hypothetical protein